MIKLTRERIMRMHDAMIRTYGGTGGLRDAALLDSALAAPFAEFGGEEPFPDIISKAARLCYGLVNNHAFVDGNKRIGAHAMVVFLSLNGVELEYEQKELIDVTLGVAAGDVDVGSLIGWIDTHWIE